jgi:hypothetical protein
MEVGGKKRGWGQVGGMAQQCMHIWINELKNLKK